VKRVLCLITFFLIFTGSAFSQWEAMKYLDEFDDTEYWNVKNKSPLSYSEDGQQYLTIGFDQNTMWLLFRLGTYIGTVDSRHVVPIRFRFDKNEVESEFWEYESGRDIVFVPNYPSEMKYQFIYKMLAANQLLFEATKYNYAKVTAKYSLIGFKESLAEAFGVPLDGVAEQITTREKYENDHPIGK